MSEKPFSICLLGCSFNTGNRGVSALAASLINILLASKPDARIWFFIGDRTDEAQSCIVDGKARNFNVVNYRLSLRSKPHSHLAWMFLAALLYNICPLPLIRKGILRRNPALAALVQADIIGDIRGGDSFSDIYGLTSFLLGTVPVFIIRLLGKKLVLLPQTYGPFDHGIARRVAWSVVGRAACALSRDREGLKAIQDLLGSDCMKSGRIRFCPDVAFHLEPQRPSTIETVPRLPPSLKETVPAIAQPSESSRSTSACG